MDEIEQIDPLDQQLREAAPYIDDAGFTLRVLQQLPARRRPQSLRAVILLGITLLGSILAYVISDGGRFLYESFARVAALSPLMLLLVTIGTGVLATSLGIAVAVAKNHELEQS